MCVAPKAFVDVPLKLFDVFSHMFKNNSESLMGTTLIHAEDISESHLMVSLPLRK